MIFRRTNDISPAKAGTTNSGTRPAPTVNNAASRREPEVSSRPSTMTPVSPIAMAQQARRTTTTTPGNTMANNYNRTTEQLRKLTVGRDITLNGEITTCDHLIVEGNVTATIKAGQILEIMESGTYSGLVDIDQADIAGTFDGELTVRGKLTLRPTAVVTGLIRYGRLQVDAGAVLNGQLGALPPANEATTETTSTQTTDNQNYNTLASINDQPGFLKVSA
jgi:cytoskeletal protein CcmA (bactofilin family)